MKPFYLKLTVNNIILPHRCHLDGILGAAIAEDSGTFTEDGDENYEALIKLVPLKMTNGVFHCSQAFLTMDGSEHSLSLTSRTLRKNSCLAITDAVSKLPTESGNAELDGTWKQDDVIKPAKPRYKTITSKRSDITPKNVWFFGVGDIEQISQYMKFVKAIGTWRNKGYGNIIDMEIDEVETRNEFFGMIDNNGTPMRVLPLPAFDIERMTNLERVYESYQFPYWKSEKTMCVAPVNRKTELKHNDLIDNVA